MSLTDKCMTTSSREWAGFHRNYITEEHFPKREPEQDSNRG